MAQVRGVLRVSERRVCQVIGHCRGTQRYRPKVVDDEAGLTAAIINYAARYGRYGYRRILALLWEDGWVVNHKRTGAHLAPGGAKGAPEAAQAGQVVVNRRLLCASPALLAEPCVVL